MAFGAKTRQVGRLQALWAPVRRFLDGWVSYCAAVFVYVIRPLRFLHPILPRELKHFVANWDKEMLRTFVFSFGRRTFIDQRCTLRDPATYAPLVDVDPEYALSERDVKFFYDNGYLGPFTLCPREEMIQLRETVKQETDKVSKIYGFETGRDRHLDCPSVYQLVMRQALTERLAQLLGPNLLLWRSQVFLKEPGAPGIAWHQASTYLMEEGFMATLYPPDRDPLFQVTTWLAFDDVDVANGCLQFLPGSHRRINTMRLGESDDGGQFANAKMKLEVDIDSDALVSMEMEAGQFVLFCERVVHGSPPNHSDRRRWGMAFRTIQPDVMVYGEGKKKHNVRYLEETYDLSKWGAVVLRGEDTAAVNRLVEPFPNLSRVRSQEEQAAER